MTSAFMHNISDPEPKGPSCPWHGADPAPQPSEEGAVLTRGQA